MNVLKETREVFFRQTAGPSFTETVRVKMMLNTQPLLPDCQIRQPGLIVAWLPDLAIQTERKQFRMLLTLMCGGQAQDKEETTAETLRAA